MNNNTSNWSKLLFDATSVILLHLFPINYCCLFTITNKFKQHWPIL